MTVLSADEANLDATTADVDPRVREVWLVRGKNGDTLQISPR